MPSHPRNLISRLAVLLTLATVCLTLVACASSKNPKTFETREVASQEEAGSTQISVLFVAPWEEYVDDLQPRFSLTSADALERVLPTTTRSMRSVVDARGFGLGVGLPTSSTESRSEIVDQVVVGGETPGQTTTTTTTTTENAGETPDPPADGPAGERTAAGNRAGDLFNSAIGLGRDPMLEHLAATALYQEVQLLNRYLQHPARRYGFRPYLVRMQVGVIPEARFQPYDVHLRMSFFTGFPSTEPDETFAAPFVLPLLVTDNLETILASNSADRLRQLSLGLAGMVGNVGVDLSFQQMLEELRQILGQESNSLLTLARASDNSLHVRLGAPASPTGRFAMIPRTHNLTFVLLVPNDYVVGDPCGDSQGTTSPPTIRVVTQTSTVHATRGERLAGRTLQQAKESLYETFDSFLDLPRRPRADLLDEFFKLGMELLGHAQQNDLKGFLTTLHRSNVLSDEESEYLAHYSDSLWVSLIGLMEAAREQAASFHLPPIARRASLAAGAEQTFVLLDNVANETTSVTLTGGQGLAADRLQAVLRISEGKQTWTFAAQRIAVSGGGREIRLTFPSLKKLGLRLPPSPKASLELELESDPWLDEGCSSPSTWELRRARYLDSRKEPPPPDPGFELALGAGVIIAEEGGQGSLKVMIEIHRTRGADGAERPATESITLEVASADLAAVTSVPADAIRPFQGLQKVEVTKSAVLDLSLDNLEAGKTISIKAKSKAGVEHPEKKIPVRSNKS